MEIMGESSRRNKCRSVLFLIDVYEPEGCRFCPCVREGTLDVVFRTLLALESTSQPFRWQYCLFDSSLSPLHSDKRIQAVLAELRESLPPVVEDGIEESTRRRLVEPRLKNRKGFWASDLARLKSLSADASAFFQSACPRPGCTGAKQGQLPSEPEAAPSGGLDKSTEDVLLTNIWRGLSGLTDAKYSWSHEDASCSPILPCRRQGGPGGVEEEAQPSSAAHGLGLDYAHFLNHVVLITAAPGVPSRELPGTEQPRTGRGDGLGVTGRSSSTEQVVAKGFQAVQMLLSSLKLQLCWSVSAGASTGDPATHCQSSSKNRNSVSKCHRLASLKAVVKRAGCRGHWSLSCMECVRRSCMEGEHRPFTALEHSPATWSSSLEAHVTCCLRYALVRPVSGLHQLACKASFFLQTSQDLVGGEEQAAPSPVLLCTLPPMSQVNPQPLLRPFKPQDRKEERGREQEIWHEPKPKPLPREPSIYESLSFLKGSRHKSLGALSLQLLSLEGKSTRSGDEPMLSLLLTTREGKEGGSRAQDQQLSFLLFLDFLRQHQLQACVQVSAKGGTSCGGLIEWYAPGIAILSVRAPPKVSASGAIPLLRGCSTTKDAPATTGINGAPEGGEECLVRRVADRTVRDAGATVPQVDGCCPESLLDPRVPVAPGQARAAAAGICGGQGDEVPRAESPRGDGSQNEGPADKEGVPSDAEQVQGADSRGGAADGCQSHSCGARRGPGNAADAPADDAGTDMCNALERTPSWAQDQEEQGPLLPGNASQQDKGDESVRGSEGGTAPGKTVSLSGRRTGSLQADQVVKRKALAHMHFDELVLGGVEDANASARGWEADQSEGRGQGGVVKEEDEEEESAGDWSPAKENPYDDAFLPGTQMSQTPTRRPQSPPPAPLVLSQTGTRLRKQEFGVSGPRGASTGRDAQQKVLFVEVLCKMQRSTSSLLEAYQRTRDALPGASAGPACPRAPPEEETRDGHEGPGEGSAFLQQLHRSMSEMHSWLERRSAGGERADQAAGSIPTFPFLELEIPPCPPEQSSQRDSHQGSVPAIPSTAQPSVPERHFQSKEEASALLQSIPERVQKYMASSGVDVCSLARELVSDCAAALGFLKGCSAGHEGQEGPKGEGGEGGAGPVPGEGHGNAGKGGAAADGAPSGGVLSGPDVVAETKKLLLRKKRELQDKYRGCKEEHKLSGSPTGPFTLADKVREFELQILLRMHLLSSDDPEAPHNQRLWKPACDLLGMLSLCREGGVYAPDLSVYAGDLLWKRYHESFPRVLEKMYEHLAFEIPQALAATGPSSLLSPTATEGVPSSSFPVHAFDCAMSMGTRTKGGTGAERTASGIPQRSRRSGEWSQGGSQGGGERSVQGGSIGAATAATASSRGETKLLMQGASSRRMALLRQVLPAGSSQPSATPAALPRSGSSVTGAEGTSAFRGTPREHSGPPVKARANPRKSSNPKHHPQSPSRRAPTQHAQPSRPVKSRTPGHGSAAAARQEAESLRRQQQQQQQARARWGPLWQEAQGAPGSGAGGMGPHGDGKRKRPEGAGTAHPSGAAKKQRHKHGDTSKGGGGARQQAAGAGRAKGGQTDVFAARAGTFLVSFLAEAQQGKGMSTGAAERKEKPAARTSSGHTKDGTHTAGSAQAPASSRGAGSNAAEHKAHGLVSPATGGQADRKKPSTSGRGEVHDTAAGPDAVIGVAAPQEGAAPVSEPQAAPVPQAAALGCSETAVPAAPGGGHEKGAENGPMLTPANPVGETAGTVQKDKAGMEGGGREGREGVGAPGSLQREEEQKGDLEEAGEKEKRSEERGGKAGMQERGDREEKERARRREKDRAKRARQKRKNRQGRRHPEKARPAMSDGTVLGPASGFPPEDEHEADISAPQEDIAADRRRFTDATALLAADEGKGPGQGSGAGKRRGPGGKGLSKTAQHRLFSKWHAKSRQKLWKPAPLLNPKKVADGPGAADGVPQADPGRPSTKWGQAGPFAMLKGKTLPSAAPASGQAGDGGQAVDGGEDGSARADPGSHAQQQQQSPESREAQPRGGSARQRSRKPAKPLKSAPAKGTKGKGGKAGEAGAQAVPGKTDPAGTPGLVLPPPPSLALLAPPPARAAAGHTGAAPSIFSLLGRTMNAAPVPAIAPGGTDSALEPAPEKPSDSLSLLTSLQALRKVAPTAASSSATAPVPGAAEQRREPALGEENSLQLSLGVTPQRSQASPLQSVPVNTATACKAENLKGTKGSGGDSPENGNGPWGQTGRGTGGENRGSGGGGGAKASATRRGSGAQGGGRRSTRSTAGVPGACLPALEMSAAADEDDRAQEAERAGAAPLAPGPAEGPSVDDETCRPDGTQPVEGSQPSEGAPGRGAEQAATAEAPAEQAGELEVERPSSQEGRECVAPMEVVAVALPAPSERTLGEGTPERAAPAPGASAGAPESASAGGEAGEDVVEESIKVPASQLSAYQEAVPSPKEAAPSPKEAVPSPKEAAPSPKEDVPSPKEAQGQVGWCTSRPITRRYREATAPEVLEPRAAQARASRRSSRKKPSSHGRMEEPQQEQEPLSQPQGEAQQQQDDAQQQQQDEGEQQQDEAQQQQQDEGHQQQQEQDEGQQLQPQEEEEEAEVEGSGGDGAQESVETRTAPGTVVSSQEEGETAKRGDSSRMRTRSQKSEPQQQQQRAEAGACPEGLPSPSCQETAATSQGNLPEAQRGSQESAGTIVSPQEVPSSQEENAPVGKPQKIRRSQSRNRRDRESPEETELAHGEQQLGVSTRRQKEQQEGRTQAVSLCSARTRGARSAPRREMLSGAMGHERVRAEEDPGTRSGARRGSSKRVRPDAEGSSEGREPQNMEHPSRRVSPRLNLHAPRPEGGEAGPIRIPSTRRARSRAKEEDDGVSLGGPQESPSGPSPTGQQVGGGVETEGNTSQAHPIVLGESVSCSSASTLEGLDSEVAKRVGTGTQEGGSRGEGCTGKDQGESEVAKGLCASKPEPSEDAQKAQVDGAAGQQALTEDCRNPLTGSEPPPEPAEYLCFARPQHLYTGFMLALPAPTACHSNGRKKNSGEEPLGAADDVVQDLGSPLGKGTGSAEAAARSGEESPAGATTAPAQGEVGSEEAGAGCPDKTEELPDGPQGPEGPGSHQAQQDAEPGHGDNALDNSGGDGNPGGDGEEVAAGQRLVDSPSPCPKVEAAQESSVGAEGGRGAAGAATAVEQDTEGSAPEAPSLSPAPAPADPVLAVSEPSYSLQAGAEATMTAVDPPVVAEPVHREVELEVKEEGRVPGAPTAPQQETLDPVPCADEAVACQDAALPAQESSAGPDENKDSEGAAGTPQKPAAEGAIGGAACEEEALGQEEPAAEEAPGQEEPAAEDAGASVGGGAEALVVEEPRCAGDSNASAAGEPGVPAAAAPSEVDTPVDEPSMAGSESRDTGKGLGGGNGLGDGKGLSDGKPRESGSSWDSRGTEEGAEDMSTQWRSEKQGGGSKKVYTRKRKGDQGSAEDERTTRTKRRAARALTKAALHTSLEVPSEERKAERAAVGAAVAAQAGLSGENEKEDAQDFIAGQAGLVESVPGEVACGLPFPMLEVHEACEQQEMEAAAMMEYECTQRAQGDPGPTCTATPRSSLDLGPCSDLMHGAHDLYGASSHPSGSTAQGPECDGTREEGPEGRDTSGEAQVGAVEGVKRASEEGEEAGPGCEALGVCLGSQGTEQSHTVGGGADLAHTAAPACGPPSSGDARHTGGAAQAPPARAGAIAGGRCLPADSLDKIADALCPSEEALGALGQGLAASWPGGSTEHGISSSADAVSARLRTEEECQSLSQGPHGAHDESAACPDSAEGGQGAAEGQAQAVQAGPVVGVGNPSGAAQGGEAAGKEGLLATLQNCSQGLSESELRILLNLAKALPAIASHLPGVPSVGVLGTEAPAGASREHSAGGRAGGDRLSRGGSEGAGQPEQRPEGSPAFRDHAGGVKRQACACVEAPPGPRAAPRCVGDASPAESTMKGKQEQQGQLQTPLTHRMRMDAPGSTERGSSSSHPSPAIKSRKQMTITALFKPSPKGQDRRTRETILPST